MAATGKKSALFVCLGNICRSPISEAVLQHLVNQRGLSDQWDIDSAATADYHTGAKPDIRARDCMKNHDVNMEHRARQLTDEDYTRFNYIFGMDDNNISDIKRMAPKSYTAKIELLGDYDPEKVRILRDPYYDNHSKGFEDVYVQSVRCCNAFLDKIYAKYYILGANFTFC